MAYLQSNQSNNPIFISSDTFEQVNCKESAIFKQSGLWRYRFGKDTEIKILSTTHEYKGESCICIKNFLSTFAY